MEANPEMLAKALFEQLRKQSGFAWAAPDLREVVLDGVFDLVAAAECVLKAES